MGLLDGLLIEQIFHTLHEILFINHQIRYLPRHFGLPMLQNLPDFGKRFLPHPDKL